MTTIIVLEDEAGEELYLNPHHVIAVTSAGDSSTKLSSILTAYGGGWRVKGEAGAVAAHIFAVALDDGRRAATFQPVGAAKRKQVVQQGAPSDTDAT